MLLIRFFHYRLRHRNIAGHTFGQLCIRTGLRPHGDDHTNADDDGEHKQKIRLTFFLHNVVPNTREMHCTFTLTADGRAHLTAAITISRFLCTFRDPVHTYFQVVTAIKDTRDLGSWSNRVFPFIQTDSDDDIHHIRAGWPGAHGVAGRFQKGRRIGFGQT